MGHPPGGLVLLGSPQILIDFRPVIDDDAGLERTGESNQLFSLPVVLPLALHPGPVACSVIAAVGKVEPENVDFSVIGQKLRDLVAHILRILFHVAALILFKGVRIIPAGMVQVNGKIGMVPVNQRVVETDVQSFCTEGVHVFTD